MEVLTENVFENIEIRLIKPSQFILRNEFLEKDLDDEKLLQSIKNHGLLQPIVVRPVTNSFEIVAGHRRYKACKSLKWRLIPSNVIEVSDMEAFELQLTENIQRKSMNPIEEAEAFRRYINDYGWGGMSELASRIGKSQEYVSHRIQLLSLSDDVKKQIITNQIKSSQAYELINIPSEKQIELIGLIKEQDLTVKQIRQIKNKINDIDTLEYSGLSDNIDEALKMIRKTTLTLKISLARMDSLIQEIKNISTTEQTSLIVFLMGLRLKIHSMIDDAIHFKNSELKCNKNFKN